MQASPENTSIKSRDILSPELLKKVRLLEIRTRLQVRDVFGGRYHSVFKGQGMDFDEVREYSPGDDIRHIDWNVSARIGEPYIKVFREERELTVMLIVDVSGSGEFGTSQLMKREVAAELTALFALSAMFNNDKVGLMLFTEEVEKFVSPSKGRKHVLRIIRDVLAHNSQKRGTNIGKSIEFALHALKKRAVVFLITDFMDDGWKNALKVAAKKHDIITIEVFDPRDRTLPQAGIIPLRDNETGEIVWVDTNSKKFVESYNAKTIAIANERATFLRQINVDHISLSIDKPYWNEIMKFFSIRESRK